MPSPAGSGGKVNIDIFDSAQAKQLSDLKAAGLVANKTKYTLANVKVGTTNANGEIDFVGLANGVYLLEETKSTATDGKVYKAAAPSLIFLPTTDPKGEGWLVDDGGNPTVYVYPKNSLDENIKTVDDANKQVGERISYTISTTIPAVSKLDEVKDGRQWDLTHVVFWDKLDQKLAFTAEDATDGHLEVKYGTDNQKNTLDSGDYTVKVNGQDLAVSLNAAGLNKVAAEKDSAPETKVYLSFQPLVKESGVVPNAATVYKNAGDGAADIEPNNPPRTPPGVGEKTNVVASAWGKIVLHKKNSSGVALEGAQFKLYGLTNENQNADAATLEAGTTQIKGLGSNPDGVFTTDTQGCIHN